MVWRWSHCGQALEAAGAVLQRVGPQADGPGGGCGASMGHSRLEASDECHLQDPPHRDRRDAGRRRGRAGCFGASAAAGARAGPHSRPRAESDAAAAATLAVANAHSGARTQPHAGAAAYADTGPAAFATAGADAGTAATAGFRRIGAAATGVEPDASGASACAGSFTAADVSVAQASAARSAGASRATSGPMRSPRQPA